MDLSNEEKLSVNGDHIPPVSEDATIISRELENITEDYIDENDENLSQDDSKHHMPTKFEVDLNKIESVTVDNQATEIQSLGLTVYDQSALERGIWDQVEEETRKRETEEKLANISTKLKFAEEHLKRVAAPVSNKRSILQDALEEPCKRRRDSQSIKEYQGTTQKQVRDLRLKQAELEARLSSNKNSDPKEDESKGESERDRKIRMGEMTPFGTAFNATSSGLHSFEKYLKSQQELHKKMMSGVKIKNKSGNPSISMQQRPNKQKKAEDPKISSSMKTSSNQSNILKKNILFPKKRQAKENLGTDLSTLEEDQNRLPGKSSAECAVVDLEESGSEYLPSGSEDDADYDTENKATTLNKQPKKNTKVSLSPQKKRSSADRWAGGSLKRRRKTVQMATDDQEWKSDDSDWICTDDEEHSSDDNSGKRVRRQGRRTVDDGNAEDFYRRVRQWEKENDGIREQMEQDVHEFENGFKLPNIIWNKLYKYQQVGVRWMWELNQQRCGGILGDEMGLGKTIQIIAYLAGLSTSKLKCRTTGYRGLGPTLIVCPTTVMHQWVRELHAWFPQLRVAILHESGSYIGKRSQLVRDMLHARGVMITSYTAVVRLKDYLLHQHWHYVILDEGHKIRNPDAQITLAVKQLRTPHRIILSGSPLQNNLRELWSLMDFVFPGKLGTLPVFMAEFAVPISQGGYSNASEVMVATAYKCATVLRDTIAPYLLRRMKADVGDHINLPAKNEQVLFCRLTDEQRDLYKGYLQCGEVGRILDGRCQIFVGLINLRKICNHPHLYSGGPKLFAHEKEEDIQEEERFGYWEKSGKMVVIEALLKMWKKQEHRVLIFTQSRQMLLIMEKFVSDKGYSYLKLDGGTSIAARQPLINKFNENKSYFLMLLTTKVGGLGVNLTGANRVVIYDPDWNPATDTQARERAWRIGQQNAVTIYRLITAGTIEEKMYHRQIFKQFLCNKVLKDPRQRRFFKSNDLLELFTLKETDESTETAAIFAGTNSQVHVKPKLEKQKREKDLKHKHSSNDKKKIEAHSKSKKLKKVERIAERPIISFSQDKLEHMKKLAHELSLKFSNKVASVSENNIETGVVESSPAGVAVCPRFNKVENDNVSEDCEKVCIGHEENPSVQTGTLAEISSSANETDVSPPLRAVESTILDEVIPEDSDEDLEIMKQLAQELSKELSEKVQTAATLNASKANEKDISSNESEMTLIVDSGITDTSTSSAVLSSSSGSNKEKSPSASEGVPHFEGACGSSTQHSAAGSSSSTLDRYDSIHFTKTKQNLLDENVPFSKHKRHKKHKKHKHRDALLEGERVRGLVKASALEKKEKKESFNEASHNTKQDDYVLRKLFAKTGIKTAMQHDKVMESGHADYALVEGEAKRVAQEAVKAMKASRQHCWTPMSGQPTWTGASGSLRPSQDGGNSSQSPKLKFGKKKRAAKTTSSSLGTEPNQEAGSSSVLARIRARNLLLTDEDDENAAAGVLPSVPDKNKELLDDIRTFVSFGASVDGRATTDEIVSQFRDRLPPQSSALFKQMLMQICEFHRLPSGQGVWKLTPDFQW